MPFFMCLALICHILHRDSILQWHWIPKRMRIFTMIRFSAGIQISVSKSHAESRDSWIPLFGIQPAYSRIVDLMPIQLWLLRTATRFILAFSVWGFVKNNIFMYQFFTVTNHSISCTMIHDSKYLRIASAVIAVSTRVTASTIMQWTWVTGDHALPSVSCPWDGISEHALSLLFIGGLINYVNFFATQTNVFGLMVKLQGSCKKF